MESLFANLSSIDPNIVYLGLIVGLWLGVTAVYIPGTGIMEGIALLVLAAVAVTLTQMPTNWWAVLLIVVGASSFLILPFIIQRWAHYAEAGLVLQAIGGILLFDSLSVAWLLVAATVLLAILYHRFVLLPLLATQKRVAEFDDERQLVGSRGHVMKTLDPVGTVQVHGELWTARSHRKINSGDDVVVIERHGLELIVEKPKRKEYAKNPEEV